MTLLRSILKTSLPKASLVGVVTLMLFIGRNQAAILTWDANGTTAPNPSDGSGNWLTTSGWLNGSGNVNGTWTSGNPVIAFFGAGISGDYVVTLGGGSIYASNVTFTTSGYTLANGSLRLSTSSGTNLIVSNNIAAT